MQSRSDVQSRRDRVARAWDLSRGAVVIPSGLPIPIEGTDQAHDFHAHAEFAYLSGRAVSNATLTFDPAEGWTLFGPVASDDDRIWTGDSEPLESLRETTGINTVRPAPLLQTWLEHRRGEPVALLGHRDITRRPAEYGATNWPALELDLDTHLSARLSEQLSEARRVKDASELALMRAAATASIDGHLLGMRLARAGMTERDLQIEIEAEFFRRHGDRTAYGSIVGSGPNGAILHVAPSPRALAEGDLLLCDAGAEVEGYASDVTRTYPISTRFSGMQRDLYSLVLATQEASIAKVRPGIEYRELHMQASEQIAAGLADLGILRGAPADLVERDAHALFFPHGLGHMLGLATHDAGGCLAGRTPSDRFGLKWLRADLPLEAGYVVTVEPGIYFIRAILQDPTRRETYRDCVDWDKVDGFLDFGGIRIEDDVLVTIDGHEVLTGALPKSVSDIEAIREEALPR